jgi:uncharacterized protein (TIGR00266 family)
MKTKITGTTLPVLEVSLEGANEMIIAEPGEFSWMTESVTLKTTTMTAGAKGLFGVLGRALSGGGLFMTEYTAPSGTGLIAFAAKVPGQIMQVDVAPGKGYMVARSGFLCATQGVSLSVGFQKSLGAGLFGGNGFILQHLEGTCSAWIEIGGEIVTYDLAAGESLQVHPGHIGMFEDSVKFDLRFMKGITNAFFGGDGLFIGNLTGPGKVWLQTLTLPNLAHALQPYIVTETAKGNAEAGIAGGVAGAVMKGMFGGK